MKALRITLLQTPLIWEDIQANLQAFEARIGKISDHTDLIVLPEMFTTGFTMNTAEMAQPMDGGAVAWIRSTAAAAKASVAGSMIIREKDACYNRLIYAHPDGKPEYYDKRHLFRMAEEHHYFSAGQEKVIVEEQGWKINLQVCYDLRFPVWSRNSYVKSGEEVKAAYDVLIYVANWPEARINAWDILLQARAIENQCYVIGVNRVGKDGKGIFYNGHSRVIDPKGNVLAALNEGEEDIRTVSLDYDELAAFREKFPVGLDAD